MHELMGVPLLQALSAASLVVSLWIYVLLDGTDLGTGMLCAFQPDEDARHKINLSLLPIWDGNETWLVLAAGSLFGLFPLAYAIILSALYVPVFTLVLALVVRGMAIEYRHYAPRLFDTLLVTGSLLATLAQGIIAGSVIQTIPNNGQQFTGTGWEWLSPFPLFCALSLVAVYCLMGEGWLIWRGTGALAHRARRVLPWLTAIALLLMAGVLFWSGHLQETWRLHLQNPGIWLPFAGTVLVGGVMVWFSLKRGYPFLPLAGILVLVSSGFGALVFTLYPWIVPASITLHQAAAPPETQRFLLISFALLAPVTLLYNTWGFRLFSGKIR
ncbi:cytochrome d ubiquinol oxidase subunit II [Leclercia sp.]|uniref:cytochrome d ubiquinol oxidase subunit II n=1 Tax=Leclercia sp. TaxID=1898428 RepID=UPI002FDE23FE